MHINAWICMELTQTKIESATELVGQYEVGFM